MLSQISILLLIVSIILIFVFITLCGICYCRKNTDKDNLPTNSSVTNQEWPVATYKSMD